MYCLTEAVISREAEEKPSASIEFNSMLELHELVRLHFYKKENTIVT